jgi:hypothetical protein
MTVAVVGVLAISGWASAQEAKVTQEEKVYVGTAFEVSFQNEGTAFAPVEQPKPAVSGSALGFAVTVGRRLSPLVSLAVEARP